MRRWLFWFIQNKFSREEGFAEIGPIVIMALIIAFVGFLLVSGMMVVYEAADMRAHAIHSLSRAAQDAANSAANGRGGISSSIAEGDFTTLFPEKLGWARSSWTLTSFQTFNASQIGDMVPGVPYPVPGPSVYAVVQFRLNVPMWTTSMPITFSYPVLASGNRNGQSSTAFHGG